MQSEVFIANNQEHMVCKLKRSIYGLKQASRSQNIRFDQAIKSFGFEQNLNEPCVYKRHQDKVVMFLVLYVDDILLIGNDVGVMSSVKIWLSSQFDMKDLGEANFILGIKLWRDRKNKMLDYHKLDIQIRFQNGLACKTPRRDYFLSDMEFLYLMTKGLRLKRKQI